MKTCEKCGIQFETWVTINKEKHNLCNRKFCLDCSPFGLHNTKPLGKKETITTLKCTWHVCNNLQRNNNKFCSDKCSNKYYVDKRRKAVKQKAVEYKGGKCEICGYNKCSDALHFHHSDPTEKDFAISKNGHSRSWERVRNEIDKCILICANCHAEEHAKINLNMAEDIGIEPIRSKTKA